MRPLFYRATFFTRQSTRHPANRRTEMKRQSDFNLFAAIAIALFLFCATASMHGVAETRPSAQDPDRALLQRVYEMRMRLERERAERDNEARANTRLVTQSAGARVDSPTVSGLRSQTNNQLARYEQQFRCLDVDVDNNGGNTVVICGDNSGDVTGTNVSAGGDMVTVNGGQP
jgi:hypothetical protein